MDVVAFVIGKVLPYITILVLVVGLIARIAKWMRAPQPKMTVYPGSKTTGKMITEIAKEVLIFRSLFKGNKSLWAGSWVFHAMLAFIAMGHIRVLLEPWFLWNIFGLDQEGVNMVSSLTGGTFGVVVLIACLYLLIRRLAVVRAREISDVEDYAALLLIIAIVATGDGMRFISHFEITEARTYFASLVTFSGAAVPTHPWFLAHYLLAQLLFLYLPFSKFLHIPGVFVSQPMIQKV